MKERTLPLFGAPEMSSDFSGENRVIVHHGDSLEFLRTIPDETVQLIISSPPYNLGKAYEIRTDMETYLREQEPVMRELKRVLRPQGSLCWEVGNFVEGGEVFPLDVFYYGILKKMGLQLRNRIVWHFGHGLHGSRRFSGRYETVLWFTKTGDYVFNLDAVRVPSKYPGKRHYKGPNKGKPSGNPLGKNPGDVWELISQEWDEEVWAIPNVKSNHPEKTIHPCQFPIELVERFVLALTREDEWILDPYCGVGSALVAALRRNRKAMGCDKEAAYIDIARQRIESYFNGTLKIRPLGRPVHAATGHEKVAQVPDEWEREEGDCDQ